MKRTKAMPDWAKYVFITSNGEIIAVDEHPSYIDFVVLQHLKNNGYKTQVVGQRTAKDFYLQKFEEIKD